MKKSIPLAIIVLVLAISTAVLGYMYTTKGQGTTAATTSLAIAEISDKWAKSAHADPSAAAFRHWDEKRRDSCPLRNSHSTVGFERLLRFGRVSCRCNRQPGANRLGYRLFSMPQQLY